ncbi:MAG: 1-phosphofructokinase family hexose kinase [Candidatus Bipolaricaulota bacterium]
MIVTVTLNPAVDRIYWVDSLRMCEVVEEEYLTRATRSATCAGGKGVNMSILLAQLGVESVAMGFIGGFAGRTVVGDLRDKGVTTHFVWTRGETRTNVTVLEKGRAYVPIFIDEAGSPVEERDVERFMKRYQRMLERATWVVLAGSLPPNMDPGIYYDLARRAREAGARVVLSAGGEALERALEAGPAVVKPDTRADRRLLGGDLDSRDAVIAAGREMVSRGAGIVLISHDITGDIAVTRDGVWEIQTSVKVSDLRNLIGADDALLAGVLYQLDREATLEDALRFGLAAGIATAESDLKLCGDPQQIRAEMERITVKQIGGGVQ